MTYIARRAKIMCRHPGCSTLLSQPGYCAKHAKQHEFKKLDKRKDPERVAFYRTYKWRRTSEQHRIAEPLCRQCKENGIIEQAYGVHHNPDLSELLAKGLDPLDEKYLESICFNCHQKELRRKRGK